MYNSIYYDETKEFANFENRYCINDSLGGSPSTNMIKLCDCSIMAIEDNKLYLSKERVMDSDHFCFRKPIPNLVHIRQVFTHSPCL